MTDHALLDLADLAPVSQAVTVRTRKGETQVYFRGLAFEEVVTLVAAFPEVMAMIVTRSFDAKTIIAKSPQTIHRIVALTLEGAKGSTKDKEQWASKLPVGLQAEILTKVWGATFPNGVAPLIEWGVEMGIIDANEAAAMLGLLTVEETRGIFGAMSAEPQASSSEEVSTTAQ